ncbi:hypothetical protein D3C85_1605990 [compost metagenome]
MARRDVIRSRYKKAFGDYYRLYDEYVAVCKEYNGMPKCVLGSNEQACIDVAGGRQLKAGSEMAKWEIAVTKNDRAISSTKDRAARYAVVTRPVSAPSRATVATPGVAMITLQ